MRISSAATVTTVETLRECKISISTLRRFEKVPVYVACDSQEVADEISKVEGVRAIVFQFQRPSVATHNNYHRPDAIAVKIPIMREAMKNHPDVLFFDADIIAFQISCSDSSILF